MDEKMGENFPSIKELQREIGTRGLRQQTID
jgi:hypothetical protein